MKKKVAQIKSRVNHKIICIHEWECLAYEASSNGTKNRAFTISPQKKRGTTMN